MWRGEGNHWEERERNITKCFLAGLKARCQSDRREEGMRDDKDEGKEGACEDRVSDIAPPGEANDLKAERRLTAERQQKLHRWKRDQRERRYELEERHKDQWRGHVSYKSKTMSEEDLWMKKKRWKQQKREEVHSPGRLWWSAVCILHW